MRVALYRRSGAASYLFCFVSFAAAAACFFFSFFLRCPLTNRIALRIAVVVFVASIPALCHRSIEEVATVTTSILATRVNDKMLSIKSECKTATANCWSSLSTVSLSLYGLYYYNINRFVVIAYTRTRIDWNSFAEQYIFKSL